MFIADGQVHIWGPDTPERPWLAGQKPHREPPLGPDELLREMDAAGVQRAVVVPPYWEGDRHDLVLEAARLHRDRFAAMGRPGIETPAARGLIATWCRQPGMLGCRFSFNRPHQNPYRRLHPYLRRVYDAFGPRRIFWGADLSRLPCSYRQAVTMFTEELEVSDENVSVLRNVTSHAWPAPSACIARLGAELSGKSRPLPGAI